MTNAQLQSAPSWAACAAAKAVVDAEKIAGGGSSEATIAASREYGRLLRICAREKGMHF